MVDKRTHRGTTSWYFQFEVRGSGRADRRRIRKFGFSTKKEAELAEAEARLEEEKRQRWVDPAAPPVTLEQMLEKFYALHCTGPQPLAPKTVERYRRHLGYLSRDLREMEPNDITRVHWTAEWSRLLAEGGRTRKEKTPRPLGVPSVLSIAATVASAYKWACLQGFVKQNEVNYSQRPKMVKRRPVTVDPNQSAQLVAAAGGFPGRQVYLAAAEALGARRGELLALRWQDLQHGRFLVERAFTQFKDPETGERRLKLKATKGEESHYVTVPEYLLPILHEHRQRQHEWKRHFGSDYQDQDLIFCQPDGRPLWPDTVSASISELCRALGLPKGTSLHSLRHTHASVLLDQHVPVTAVSKRLGHRSIRTTLEIYSHALRHSDDEAAAKFDQYLKQRDQVQREERVQ